MEPKQSRFRFCLLFLIATQLHTQQHAKQSERHAVFILGINRSGTSCTTGLLKIMGLELGGNLMVQNRHNPKGFFEHIPTGRLNKLLTGKLKEGNVDLESPTWTQDKIVPELTQLVKEHLQNHFGRFDSFGIKHPGFTKFIPLYIEAAKELGYVPKLVVVVRRPQQIVKSSQKVTYQSTDALLHKICMCWASIIMWAQGYNTLVVHFDELINNPQAVVDKLHAFLPELKPYSAVKKKVDAFVDKRLQHNRQAAGR